MFKPDLGQAIVYNQWDGGVKHQTKDCGKKCPWYYKITDGPTLCLWGVAWKELRETKTPRKCELFGGKRGLVEKPTDLRKAVIRENIRLGLFSHHKRFRKTVHFHRYVSNQATLYPLVFPDKKIVY